MNFLISWLIDYFLIMFAMCTDNMFWISDSPEYPEVKAMNFNQKIDYAIYKRIIPVLTSWRDIVPAIITSLILTVILW